MERNKINRIYHRNRKYDEVRINHSSPHDLNSLHHDANKPFNLRVFYALCFTMLDVGGGT